MAKLFNIDWILWIILLLGAWLILYPHPYELLVGSLVTLPILSMIFHSRKGRPPLDLLTHDLFANKTSASPLGHLIAAILVLGYGVFPKYEIESFSSLLVPNAIAFGLMLILIMVTRNPLNDKKDDFRVWRYTFIALSLLAFGFVSTFAINCVFDSSEPEVFDVAVMDVSSPTSNSRSTFIQVTQWGDYAEPMKIEVGLDQYGDMEIGMPVKVNLKKGLFNIQWYYVSF